MSEFFEGLVCLRRFIGMSELLADLLDSEVQGCIIVSASVGFRVMKGGQGLEFVIRVCEL